MNKTKKQLQQENEELREEVSRLKDELIQTLKNRAVPYYPPSPQDIEPLNPLGHFYPLFGIPDYPRVYTVDLDKPEHIDC